LTIDSAFSNSEVVKLSTIWFCLAKVEARDACMIFFPALDSVLTKLFISFVFEFCDGCNIATFEGKATLPPLGRLFDDASSKRNKVNELMKDEVSQGLTFGPM
jgi:hypothetical protein